MEGKNLIKSGLVSIIVCTYNAEKYLAECLNSILAQEYTNFEIICVNDGSTDDSLTVLEKYAAIDSRVKIVDKANGGVASAKNAGIDYATGEFIFFVDSDDYISPDYLRLAIERINETGADGVMGEMYNFPDGNPEQLSLQGDTFDNEIITGKEALIKSINWRVHSSVLWRQYLYDGLRYDMSSLYADELSLRKLYAKCNKVAFCKGRYYYRVNPASVTKKVSPKIFEFAKEYIDLKAYLRVENVYSDCVLITEQRLFGILNWLVFYYNDNKQAFSKEDLRHGRKLIVALYDTIDFSVILADKISGGPILKKMYYKLKFSSANRFMLFSRLMYPLSKRKNK